MGKHWTPDEIEAVAQEIAGMVGVAVAQAFHPAQRKHIRPDRHHSHITSKVRMRVNEPSS